jgi:DNA-binding PadR family transcriptional regulator
MARRRPESRHRERTNLEIFVLAAVEGGLDTAYDLNRFADLSVGATLPLMERLERSGLLRSKGGPRGSKQYSLTVAGRSQLQRSWRKLLGEIPREFEAILRIGYVAAVMDTTLGPTRRFLNAAADERQRMAERRQRQANAILKEPGQGPFGRGHRWVRAHSDSARLDTEAAVLTKLAARRDLADVLLPKSA